MQLRISQVVTVFSIITLLFLTAGLSSCSKEGECTDQKAKGRIISVAGPAKIELGDTAVIAINVALDSFCASGVTGSISAVVDSTNTTDGSLIVGAEVIHSGYKPSKTCRCVADEVMTTLVYFTPVKPGFYAVYVPVSAIGSGTYYLEVK
jgi:hypothetical protein